MNKDLSIIKQCIALLIKHTAYTHDGITEAERQMDMGMLRNLREQLVNGHPPVNGPPPEPDTVVARVWFLEWKAEHARWEQANNEALRLQGELTRVQDELAQKCRELSGLGADYRTLKITLDQARAEMSRAKTDHYDTGCELAKVRKDRDALLRRETVPPDRTTLLQIIRSILHQFGCKGTIVVPSQSPGYFNIKKIELGGGDAYKIDLE